MRSPEWFLLFCPCGARPTMEQMLFMGSNYYWVECPDCGPMTELIPSRYLTARSWNRLGPSRGVE